MTDPVSHGSRHVAPDVVCIASSTPVPGFGALPVNAYLIEAAEATLIDTGLPALTDATVAAITQWIDPAELRYVFVTHCDADHVGALDALLERAPKARVVTNYLGMGKLSMLRPLAPERFYLMNPGQRLDLGDRAIEAIALPTYDAPETMGAFDPISRSLFSSDCFGALLAGDPRDPAVEDAGSLDAKALEEGMITWATVDAPWIAHTREAAFRRALGTLGDLRPEQVLGAHLPPARGLLPMRCQHLDRARRAAPFVGPDQAALEAMLGSAA